MPRRTTRSRTSVTCASALSTVAAGIGGRRVYILDEAHMLSKAAGNALLKTLEEPPEHVVFVLATTEPYKLARHDPESHPTFRFPSGRHRGPCRAFGEDRRPRGLQDQRQIAGRVVPPRCRVGPGCAFTARAGRGAWGQARSIWLGCSAASGWPRPRCMGAWPKPRLKATLGGAGTRCRDGEPGYRSCAALSGEAIGYFRGVFLAHYAPNLAEVADEPERGSRSLEEDGQGCRT